MNSGGGLNDFWALNDGSPSDDSTGDLGTRGSRPGNGSPVQPPTVISKFKGQCFETHIAAPRSSPQPSTENSRR